MDAVSAEAGRTKIWDIEGREHELKETWAVQPVVLAFVRHFG